MNVRELPDGEGDCYKVACDTVLNSPAIDMLLCHGIATGQGKIKGTRFGHAWVEIGDTVIDFSNGLQVMISRERYYEIGKLTDVAKYDREQVWAMLDKHEHYGPWPAE